MCLKINEFQTLIGKVLWDAECVARVLVNQLDQLPDATSHVLYWPKQQSVTRRHTLVKAQGALKNQLHSLG
ncbi:hypothetical protein BIV59_14155 [Bacillus sp. MUM 13]|nr:hypothetical protein BIV59_14155 [Bacillus sp. MUM 13]